MSKLIKSRDEWKQKAMKKTYEAKEARKAKKYQKTIIKKLREENKILTIQNDEYKKKQ
jgi:hypothetical protein